MVHSVWHSPTVLEVLALRKRARHWKRSIRFSRRARLFAFGYEKRLVRILFETISGTLFRLVTAKTPTQPPPSPSNRDSARSTPADDTLGKSKNQPVLIRVRSSSPAQRARAVHLARALT